MHRAFETPALAAAKGRASAATTQRREALAPHTYDTHTHGTHAKRERQRRCINSRGVVHFYITRRTGRAAAAAAAASSHS